MSFNIHVYVSLAHYECPFITSLMFVDKLCIEAAGKQSDAIISLLISMMRQILIYYYIDRDMVFAMNDHLSGFAIRGPQARQKYPNRYSGTSLIPTLTPSLSPIEEVNEASCQAIGVLKDVLKNLQFGKVFRIQDDQKQYSAISKLCGITIIHNDFVCQKCRFCSILRSLARLVFETIMLSVNSFSGCNERLCSMILEECTILPQMFREVLYKKLKVVPMPVVLQDHIYEILLMYWQILKAVVIRSGIYKPG